MCQGKKVVYILTIQELRIEEDSEAFISLYMVTL